MKRINFYAGFVIISSLLVYMTNEIIVSTIKVDNVIGTHQVPDSIIVDQFTMDFDNPFNYNTQVLSSSENYSMVITGNYHISSVSNGLDAAYYYCYVGCPSSCDFNTPCNIVNEDDRITGSLRPDSDVFNSSHEYYYSFSGADTSMVFEFTDGNYGDNGGSLSISIYQSTTLGYCTADNSSLYFNNNQNGFIMKSENNTCFKVNIDNSGAIFSTMIACPN